MNFVFPSWLQKRKFLFAWGILCLAFVVSRWTELLSLPVFADEAIYIRWSQLLRVGNEYLFFSMNDGKPPLFIWTLFPWLQVFSDPLLAARSWSAIIGFAQLLILMGILRSLGTLRSSWIGAVLVLLLPFWFLQQRLGLMDGLLTLGISASWWGLILLDSKLTKVQKSFYSSVNWPILGSILLAGVGWSIALYTKTTALFWAPAFALLAVFGYSWSCWPINKVLVEWKLLATRLISFAAAGALGLGGFVVLKISPSFASLFSRSSDFSYTFAEVAEKGGQPIIDNILRVTPWLASYLRPEFLCFAVAALVCSKKLKLHWITWLLGFITIAPLIAIGKTLHPRYFLPIVSFITVSGALFLDEVIPWLQKTWNKKQYAGTLLFGALTILFVISCIRFQLLLQWSPHLTPFVLADRVQYLTSWSAGYGIPETRDALLKRARSGERTTVVTEGSFGTLPDGLLMYFDRAPEIQHLRIEGLAQYPVKYLPEWVLELAAKEEVWLLVNADRFELSMEFSEQVTLIDQTPKPYGGAALQLYKVTPKIKESQE